MMVFTFDISLSMTDSRYRYAESYKRALMRKVFNFCARRQGLFFQNECRGILRRTILIRVGCNDIKDAFDLLKYIRRLKGVLEYDTDFYRNSDFY